MDDRLFAPKLQEATGYKVAKNPQLSLSSTAVRGPTQVSHDTFMSKTFRALTWSV
jgi:hypothetical protein